MKMKPGGSRLGMNALVPKSAAIRRSAVRGTVDVARDGAALTKPDETWADETLTSTTETIPVAASPIAHKQFLVDTR